MVDWGGMSACRLVRPVGVLRRGRNSVFAEIFPSSLELTAHFLHFVNTTVFFPQLDWCRGADTVHASVLEWNDSVWLSPNLDLEWCRLGK